MWKEAGKKRVPAALLLPNNSSSVSEEKETAVISPGSLRAAKNTCKRGVTVSVQEPEELLGAARSDLLLRWAKLPGSAQCAL